MKLLTLMLSVAGFLFSGCIASQPTQAPSPTPDVGQFAKGEAIAIVKTEMARQPVSTVNCLVVYQDYGAVWREEYQGKGVWMVQATYEYSQEPSLRDMSPDKLRDRLSGRSAQSSWKVFENSNSIDQLNTDLSDIAGIC